MDRRAVRIKLTKSGQEVRGMVASLYDKHISTMVQVGGLSASELASLNRNLHRLERFWNDQILYRL